MRRILRERYVGAVLIGLLLFNAFGSLVRAIENPIMLWVQRMVQHSALSAGQPWYNKGQMLASLVDIVLNLIVALVLGLWIYRNDPKKETTVVVAPAKS